MGRDATKAAGNPWYQARKKAAEYDDRLCSRESAAEQLGMSVSSLADAELGNTKFMPVDKAVLMADRYNAPWLLNHYCLNECPIGCRHSLSDEVVGIDRVTVKLLKSLKTEKLGDVKDTLLDIAADGKITEDEKPALQEVLAYTRNYKDVVAASAGYSGVYATRGSLMDSEEKATAEKSATAIEKAISLSDKYAGTTKRAMTMDKDAFDKFIAESSGDSTFGLGHLSSWSTGDDALKRVFRSRDGDDPDSYNVVLECKSKSGVSIKDVADVDMDEVLYSKKARFKVLDTDPDYSVGKYKAVKLTLEEVGNRGDSSDLDGGPGSGNFGHEGRPGEIGGSAPSLTSTASKLFQR